MVFLGDVEGFTHLDNKMSTDGDCNGEDKDKDKQDIPDLCYVSVYFEVISHQHLQQDQDLRVFSVLQYGAECWKRIQKIEQKADVFQNKWFRRVIKVL